jgi:subtilisin family serine protease
VNLSLGSDQPSELVEQKLQEAKEAGVACIVAAGNSGGPVQYPAASKHVLAVSAIGRQGVFPQDSYHVTTADGSASSEGYFSARFSCFGPEIGVCGPGVAILSSVPPNNYAAWDGTSMATPHITGLAALILAHHPDFQESRSQYRQRSALRVDRLFQILKGSARPLALGDRARTGAGLPDAARAFGLSAAAAADLSTAGFEVTTSLPPTYGAADGVGSARPSSPSDAAIQKLTETLQRAGLLTGAVGAASVAAGGNTESSLQLLDQAIRNAGLDVGQMSGSAQPMSSGGSAGASPMDRLSARLREAGLL